MNKKYPFDPLYDENSEILILGSFPGENSKDNHFYYSDKRNQFWNILSEVFEETVLEDNQSRELFLKKHHIALWDVCKECERKGSLDKNIKNEKPNKLEKVLPPHTKINLILCNGDEAYKLYKRNIHNINTKCEKLFSSSGAANKYKKERTKQWKKYLTSK